MTTYKSGIIHITGEPDTGKTLLAIGAYHPSKTAYIFDDVKRPPFDDSDFGLFVDLVGKYSDLKLLEFYKAMKQEIDNIPDGKFDAIIFDTWARVGKAIRYYAKANPYEFREKETFAPSGTIANMEKWSESHGVEAAFISKLSQKARTLFLVTHIKEKIIAGAKSGLMEPDCGRSFSRVCNMRLWLRHNETSGVPIALVLKRISKAQITKDGVEIVNVLPRRLTPLPNDKSVWQVIDRYWQKPFGNREPTEQEKPTSFELSILDGVLTPDQKEVWHAELREKERKEQEEKEFFDTQWQTAQVRARELAKDSNLPALPLIVQSILPQMQSEFPDYSETDIAEMLK